MGDWFIGEIRAFAFGVMPSGWRLCDGSVLNIAQNQALFALLGTAFGGNGATTFGIPDLRGRVPMGAAGLTGQGGSGQRGYAAGQETVTLASTNMPAHSHAFVVASVAGNNIPGLNALLATNTKSGTNGPTPFNAYAPAGGPVVQLDASTVGMSNGGGGAHENRQPSLAMVYAIATTGLFPPRD